MSSILVWNTGSTASTETPVPDCGMAKTSALRGSELGVRGECEELTRNSDGEFIDEFTEHETHNFERNACSAVLEHLGSQE